MPDWAPIIAGHLSCRNCRKIHPLNLAAQTHRTDKNHIAGGCSCGGCSSHSDMELRLWTPLDVASATWHYHIVWDAPPPRYMVATALTAARRIMEQHA